jgi:hypothetical protein
MNHNLEGVIEADAEPVVLNGQNAGISRLDHPDGTSHAQPHLRQAMHDRIGSFNIVDRPRFSGFEQVQRNHKSCLGAS